MRKYELASYLVSLHSLLEAQEATGLEKSKTIADEYNATWNEFKQELEDQARKES